MKKHYQLLALATLSVAVVGTASVAKPVQSIKADETVTINSETKKVIVNSAQWVVEGKEPQYHLSVTLPVGLNGSVLGKTVDNQTGEQVSYNVFYKYPESKEDIIKVRPGILYVEHNPSHTYTLTIYTEDGAFSQDIFIPAYKADKESEKEPTPPSKQDETTSTTKQDESTSTTTSTSNQETKEEKPSQPEMKDDKEKSSEEKTPSSTTDQKSTPRTSQPEFKQDGADKKETVPSQTPSSTTTSQSTSKNSDGKRSLPSTGEVASGALAILGAGLVALAAWFGVKKKKG